MKKEFHENLPIKKKGKLNIYFHISENSGVGYFRQFQVAEELMNSKQANVLINDFTWGEKDMKDVDEKQIFAIANWADIIVTGRHDTADNLSKWGGIKEFFKMPVVMDTDDNVRFVRPSNPGYQGYHPGSEATHWNKIAFSRVFDAITVSTENLEKYHSKEHPKIFHVPNCIDFRLWDKWKKKTKDGVIHINFNGSSAHSEGVKIIREPLKKIMEKYENVRFSIPKVYNIYFTEWPKELQDRINFYDWMKLKQFPKKMKHLGVDIGLAPLADNMFNRAKSNLRWLEYSVQKVPTICSPVEAYKEVEHDKTGLLAREHDEWYNAMERLVRNEKLRKQLAENAHKVVYEQFNIEKNASKSLRVYEGVVKKYHDFFGPKKRFKKHKKGWRELTD